ncbi:MAG: hypothetical protein WDO19_20790 [Bacteroidota bacterium]
MEDHLFSISFESDNISYKGWINPSDKLNEAGTPVSFHVLLNEVSFGYLSFKNCQWTINEERPGKLVKLIGREIEKHYQL